MDWDFPGKNIGVSCYFLSLGDFPDVGIEPMSIASISCIAGGFSTAETLVKPISLVKKKFFFTLVSH